MNSSRYLKEVKFAIYCPLCVYTDTPETEDPCNECLATPAREDSHRPEKYKPKDEKK
ncbi:MAG: hypothetical protein J6Y02_20310 [Pseudobutyrivibrio sp.]|nr:hypothetical protein [Pseudobutyrivibrio sp.]